MSELISENVTQDKGDGIRTIAAMSRKKLGAQFIPYSSYYEKITTYVPLIQGVAQQIDPDCTPRDDHRVAALVTAHESIFHYPDMATTRAGIGAASTKLLSGKVAIIGIGGTGSYILTYWQRRRSNKSTFSMAMTLIHTMRFEHLAAQLGSSSRQT